MKPWVHSGVPKCTECRDRKGSRSILVYTDKPLLYMHGIFIDLYSKVS